jgi:hypothetical protein
MKRCVVPARVQSGVKETMDERRKYIRFPVTLQARYEERSGGGGWKECSVIDISREGMGISIYSREEIGTGTGLRMEITVPVKQEPVVMEGVLMWLRELHDDPHFNYIGGVRISSITAEDKWALMDYAYEGWQQKEGKE